MFVWISRVYVAGCLKSEEYSYVSLVGGNALVYIFSNRNPHTRIHYWFFEMTQKWLKIWHNKPPLQNVQHNNCLHHCETIWCSGGAATLLPFLLPGSWLQLISFTWRPRCKPLPDYALRVKTSRYGGPEGSDCELQPVTLIYFQTNLL